MKTKPMLSVLMLAILIAGCQTESVDTTPVDSEPVTIARDTPEAHGISSESIQNLLEKIDSSGIEFHSIMILRHDTVLAEGWWAPYEPEYIHTLYSLSKSFTSTAIGFAVQEGILSVNDKVTSFFPGDLPDSVDNRLADMEVQDLLTMSSGHETGTMPGMFTRSDGNWPRGFLAQTLSYDPGTHFMYNTGATYMLSAIIQGKTGQTVLEYLTPRLFKPLGIEGMDWEVDPQGVNTGGYGLRVRTEDIAKLGILYLNKGNYFGRQLLDSAWVETATSKLIDSFEGDGDWSQGYGYQFWQCKPAGVYRGDGAFGQFCIIVPEMELVVAVTSESKDMQASMNLLWEYLLPNVGDSPLPPDPAALASLEEKLESLEVGREDLMAMDTPVTEDIWLKENPLNLAGIALNLPEKRFTLYGEDTLDLQFGWNEWVLNEQTASIPLGSDADSRMSVRAGLNPAGELVIERQFVETAHHDRFRFNLDGEEPVVTWNESVSLRTEGNVGREYVLEVNPGTQ